MIPLPLAYARQGTGGLEREEIDENPARSWSYRIARFPWVGPFARLVLDTPILEGEDVRAAPVDYVDAADPTVSISNGPATQLKLTEVFTPLTLKESLGAYAKPVERQRVTVELRLGFGGMQIFAEDQLAIKDDDSTPEVEVVRLRDIIQAGLEATATVSGTFSGSKVTYKAGGEVLVPAINNAEDADDRNAGELTNVELFAKLSFKLVSWASLDYEFRAIRQPQLLDKFQVQNNLLLTFASLLHAPEASRGEKEVASCFSGLRSLALARRPFYDRPVQSTTLKFLALLPIPVILGLVVWAGRRPAPRRTAERAAAGQAKRIEAPALPSALKSGWKIFDKVQRFDKRTLFDRIDGAAPPYIRAGFKQSWGAEYRQAGRAEPITVDAYDMGTAEQAFGMYATERDPKYTFIEVGDEGYLAAGSLNLWRGRFYVKLAGYEEGEAMDRALKALAQDLAAALPGDAASKRVRALLALLPEEGRLARTEGYSLPPLEGIAGLSHAYFASYRRQGAQESHRLFLVSPSQAGVAARLAAFQAHFDGGDGEVRAAERAFEPPQQKPLACRLVVAEQKDAASFALGCKEALAGGIGVSRATVEQAIERVAQLLGGLEQAR